MQGLFPIVAPLDAMMRQVCNSTYLTWDWQRGHTGPTLMKYALACVDMATGIFQHFHTDKQ